MPSPTTNYGWQKPDIGASNDVWGGLINADLDGIDSTVFGLSTGVTDGSNAPPGKVGEFLTAVGSNVALTSTVAATLCTLALTPGDWDISGQAQFGGGATVTTGSAWVTPGGSPTTGCWTVQNVVQNSGGGIIMAPMRVSISTGATYTFNIQATFSGGSETVSGFLRARRMR